MRNISTIAAAALTVVGFSLASSGSLKADEFNPDSVKTAYADGYAGADRQFHAWDHRSDAENFRAKHADLYHPWRHDDPRYQEARK